MTNLNIIANYLFENPGARCTDITRHLCKVKGKTWSRGYRQGTGLHWSPCSLVCQDGCEHAGELWRKSSVMQGWMLTPEGLLYTTPRDDV